MTELLAGVCDMLRQDIFVKWPGKRLIINAEVAGL